MWVYLFIWFNQINKWKFPPELCGIYCRKAQQQDEPNRKHNHQTCDGKHGTDHQSTQAWCFCSVTSFSKYVAVCSRWLFVSAGARMLVLFLVPASQETRDPDLTDWSLSFSLCHQRPPGCPGHLFKVTCMSARCNACGPHGLNTSRGVGEKEC